ncbi:MAG: CBS domain-containing protein [Candidatus Verstraetearchaeota archaeon]|nr:CBS domain-containing protein [Candidatus Verstraetearchaeota archaeon]
MGRDGLVGDGGLKTSELMNPNVIYAEVPGSREQVLRVLKEKRISGMPVVKKGTRQLIGIITREDILRHPDEEQIALIMNREVVSVDLDATFDECLDTMKRKGFRRLPVVSNNELKGIITVGDLVHKVIANSQSSAKVSDYMRRRVLSCWGNTPVNIVNRVMRMASEYALLIIDNQERVAGIVSNTDLIRLVETKIEEKKSVLKSGSESQEWDWETSSVLYISKQKISLPSFPIHQVMSTPCITISESSTISECANKMLKHDIDQLPVTNVRDEVVGIIYDVDLIKSL